MSEAENKINLKKLLPTIAKMGAFVAAAAVVIAVIYLAFPSDSLQGKRNYEKLTSLESLLGSKSQYSNEDISASSYWPLACDIGGGFSLMLKAGNHLEDRIFLRQKHNDETRYFELEKRTSIFFGYNYSVKGAELRSFGNVSVEMIKLLKSGSKSYEVSISNINSLTGQRSYSGDCQHSRFN